MGGMGHPLVNVADGLIFHILPRIYQKKRQEQQVLGTQNRAAQLSLARRGQRHRWTGHSTVRRKSNPLNTSIKIKKGIRKRDPRPKIKSHKTYQPCGVDGPHGRVSVQRDDPTATFWPKLVTLRGYIFGTGLVDIHDPSGGGTTTSTCQIEPPSAQSTGQSTVRSSPS